MVLAEMAAADNKMSRHLVKMHFGSIPFLLVLYFMFQLYIFKFSYAGNMNLVIVASVWSDGQLIHHAGQSCSISIIIAWIVIKI